LERDCRSPRLRNPHCTALGKDGKPSRSPPRAPEGSTVYAYASELDEWFKQRQPADDPEADAAFEPEPDVADVFPEADNGNANLATPLPGLLLWKMIRRFAHAHHASPFKAEAACRGCGVAALIFVAAYSAFHAGYSRRKKSLGCHSIHESQRRPQARLLRRSLTDEMITRLGGLDPQRLG